eukprot:1795520-Pyramimonas_sp.AAC.1
MTPRQARAPNDGTAPQDVERCSTKKWNLSHTKSLSSGGMGGNLKVLIEDVLSETTTRRRHEHRSGTFCEDVLGETATFRQHGGMSDRPGRRSETF